jgi:NAD(P)-dependent dehydrogenase (short-subunit alcohol dehydrogenase family)
MNLDGKSVVVTGGARGIGLGIVQSLLERGAHVTFGAKSGGSVAEAVGRLGDRAALASVVADVSTPDGAEAIVQTAIDAFGAVDGLVANAGLYGTTQIGETTLEDIRKLIDQNFSSTFLCIQAALPPLREAKGAVVTISSLNGVQGVTGGSNVYGAAKAGVINLTESLALELAPEVRLNSIAPGFIETEKLLAEDEAAQLIKTLSEMTPAGRIGRPEEIAHGVVFALENDFLVGATLNIDGGRGIAG